MMPMGPAPVISTSSPSKSYASAVCTALPSGSKIDCTWNFRVTPEAQLSEISVEDYDALAIPGGFEKAGFYEDAYHDDFLKIIRQFHESGKIIASVHVGALPLGKSGILKNKKATTYHLLDGFRRKQLEAFGANAQDQSIVIDDNIISYRDLIMGKK